MYGRSVDVTDPDEYIAGLDEVRRPQIAELDARIRAIAPGLERHMMSGLLSYGHYAYEYASGRTGEWVVLALASNKAYISLYASPIGVEPYAARLPKASLGKGCIRFQRVSDLDLSVIDDVIRDAAAYDGKRVVHGVIVD